MATSSRKELRDRVVDVAKQLDGQKGPLVNELINLTLAEIQSPAWAFDGGDTNHNWSFNKRTTTITTVSGQSDYILARDIDKLSVVRQTNTDVPLKEVNDTTFYDLVPDPSSAGNGEPEYYVINSVQGLTTNLTSSEVLKVVSSSASDDGDTDLTVTIQGFSGGIIVSETLTMDGTAAVNGTITFDSGRPIFVSKAKNTAGTVSVIGVTSGVTYLTLGQQDRNPIFKVITLYPTPGSAMTVYLNYFTFLRPLNNDSDTPGFDEKWHHSVFWGALSKIYMHLGKETDYAFAYGVFKRTLLAMVQSDRDKTNELIQLKRHFSERLRSSGLRVKATDAVIA